MCCFNLDNFFTRVAKNMLQTFTEKPEHELASAKHLLENCIKLLDSKMHPELVTSAYYLLSELYLFGCIATDMESTSEAADNDTNQVSNHESSLLPSVVSNVCNAYNSKIQQMLVIRMSCYTCTLMCNILRTPISSLVTNLIFTSSVRLN